jgi:hypothetical protein
MIVCQHGFRIPQDGALCHICFNFEISEKHKQLFKKGNMKKSKNAFKTITIDLTDEEFLMLARKAHEQDITFNQLCVNYLEDYIKNHSSKEST